MFVTDYRESINYSSVYIHILYVGGSCVKFSVELDLPEKECQELLKFYMTEHIKRSKITERLFIK